MSHNESGAQTIQTYKFDTVNHLSEINGFNSEVFLDIPGTRAPDSSHYYS